MEGYREGVDWTELAHDIIRHKRIVKTAKNFRVTQKTEELPEEMGNSPFFKTYRGRYFCFREGASS
jgi:hypothetical protein